MQPQVNVDPIKGTIAILEDEATVSEDLEREISSAGYNVVGVADSLGAFEDIVKKSRPDAVSIDWRIHNVDQGPDALEFMHREHSRCGLVVYTKHKERVRTAKADWGADEVVIKKSGSQAMRRYLQSITQAIRVGLLRRIVGSLIDLGAAVGITLDKATRLEQESEIFNISRGYLIERRVVGENPVYLKELLERRGWWRTLDLNSFVNLPWQRKLEELIHPLDLDSVHLSVILGVSEESAEGLVRGEIPLRGFERDEFDRVDCFLSVLAHLLRISQYEVEMMPYYWSVRGLYASSSRCPPWNQEGLGIFLVNKGPSGLTEALSWIRR